jgi:hypothetical protein
MDDADPFESPRILLSGAARHIENFSTRLNELRASDWGTPSEGKEEGEIIMRAKIAVPPNMKQIVFDITNNLRSALDHAVFASTLALTDQERSGTKFPFGDNEEELMRDAKNRCKGVPRDVVDYLVAFQAYRTGNPLLWGLNKLRNTKNHRVLIPVGAQAAFGGQVGASDGAEATYEWDPTTGVFKTQIKPPPEGETAAVAFVFKLELLIGTGTFRGEPALGLFNRLLSEVERVVSAIEAETARLLRELGG